MKTNLSADQINQMKLLKAECSVIQCRLYQTNLAQIRDVVFEKTEEKPLNCDTLQFRKNDVTEPKATEGRLLQ